MATRGVVLMNLGSPDSTDVKDVKKYLNEFLMDERVIDVPYLLRFFLVKGMIVPFRAPNICRGIQKHLVERRFTFDCSDKTTKKAVQQNFDRAC